MTSALTPAYTVAGVAITADQAENMRMSVGQEYQWLMNKFLEGKQLNEREATFLFRNFVNTNIANCGSSIEPYRKSMLEVRELFYQIHRNLKS